MLVLGRKENESIIIGDNIRITIVGRSGSSIRIGVQAPEDVKVLRAELVKDSASLSCGEGRSPRQEASALPQKRSQPLLSRVG